MIATLLSILGAASIVGGAIWKLSAEISRLRAELSGGLALASSELKGQISACQAKHLDIDGDMARQRQWINKVEAKVDGHLDAHVKGEC